jgi:hypothetical protein
MNKRIKTGNTEILGQSSVVAEGDVKTRWLKPVNRLGRTTEIIAMAVSFLPFLYLYIKYHQFPEFATVIASVGTIASVYFSAWIVEPISYFPALGAAGTYMGMLAGSMAQIRVPAALIAKSVAGVKDNTQEAEIVATCGIAGSIYMNIAILIITVFCGSAIISILPASVLAAMSAYVLPSIFGALLAMFTTKGKLQLTVPVFVIAVGLGFLLSQGLYPLPSWTLLIVTILLGILTARVEYKTGVLK